MTEAIGCNLDMFIFSYNCFMIPFKMHHALYHSLTSFNNINQNSQSNKLIKKQEQYFTTIYMGCKPQTLFEANVDVNGCFRMLVGRLSITAARR